MERMTVAFIFVATVLAYSLLVLAFLIKDYTIGLLSGIGILCVGIYIAIYNVEGIDNILTEAFALISILLGFYILIRGSKEKIEEYI